MQQVYTNTSKVMIDAKGQGNLLVLPLDKLMQAAGVQSSGNDNDLGGAVGSVLPSSSSLPAASANTRDLRSRDREVR